MHEFICCEELPVTSTTSELSTPPHTLLHGPLYLSINPLDVEAKQVVLSCKEAATLLDAFTTCGGLLATAPVYRDDKRSVGGSDDGSHGDQSSRLLSSFQPFINIDTCAIK